MTLLQKAAKMLLRKAALLQKAAKMLLWKAALLQKAALLRKAALQGYPNLSEASLPFFAIVL